MSKLVQTERSDERSRRVAPRPYRAPTLAQGPVLAAVAAGGIGTPVPG